MNKFMNKSFPLRQVSQTEQTIQSEIFTILQSKNLQHILSPVISSKGLPYTLSLFTFSTTLWIVFAPIL